MDNKNNKKLNKSIAGTKTKLQSVFLATIKYVKVLFVVAFLAICLSGIYKVEANEVAVVLRFGKIAGSSRATQIKEPGLHMALPFFIDEVVKVPVKKVNEQSITTHYKSKNKILNNVNDNGYLLTGDNNVILINAKAKYKIDDPIKYVLYVDEIEDIVNGLVSSISTELVSQMTIDSLLTTQKGMLSENIRKNCQAEIDNIDCGISFVSIETTAIVPPKETEADFNKVTAAAIEQETLIKRAQQYASSKLLEAESAARQVKEEAQVNQQKALILANSEMSQFNGLVDMYNQDPEIIKNGVFRERVMQALNSSGTVIVVPADGKPPVIFLP